MTFTSAIVNLCLLTDGGMELDKRPYMARGGERIVVYLNRLYCVRITECGDKRNVVSEPFAPKINDIFSEQWEIKYAADV